MNFLHNICEGGLDIGASLLRLWESTGLYDLFANFTTYGWQNLLMVAIACFLVYLAVVKKFEPLLLLPIAFGMFIVNIPGVYKILFGTKGYIVTDSLYQVEVARGTADELIKAFGVTSIESLEQLFKNTGTVLNGAIFAPGQLVLSTEQVVRDFGLFYYIYKGVDWVIFPPIIFLGIGAMTDFGPLIANPKSMLIGAAAQLGIFITFFVALCFLGFTPQESAAIGIIGGADGPTAIYVTKKLAEHLLPAIAISAYSYMALIPIIQKPLMRLVTTEKERKIKMKQLRKVSKLEKVVFPILVSFVVGILLPDAMPLLGMLMLGNLLKESGVCGRLVDTAQNGLMNTVTIFLGVMVGSKATGSLFLSGQTLGIIVLGLCAFCMGTLGGLLVAKLMCKLSGGKINPLIGSAGVSAVPMAARISQDVGREADPDNHLLMHAMGPNVAGVIGSAIAAGVLLALFL
ncbi:MAG: sodium ion-translocating decarboxylase subunit beta [Clostridia bacterium]|nr:sodium ion-translocating decarboxylase subunit beta [Clostridia bacterium]